MRELKVSSILFNVQDKTLSSNFLLKIIMCIQVWVYSAALKCSRNETTLFLFRLYSECEKKKFIF
jgi:hypothetical protein